MIITQYINAHVFSTQAEANEAISLINQGEGIPVSDDSVTRTCCESVYYRDIFYINANSITEKYLGKPTEIEVQTEVYL